mgnify:CR=1 FL=1
MDLTAFLFAVGTVVLAEMGDKTQLLAMAFATRYKASKVLLGVLLATLLNHGLAVAVGTLLAGFASIQAWIQGLASLSFVFFALWTIRGDKLEGEDQCKTRYGAVITVAITFFLAEMGDKTQLATVALSAKFAVSPWFVLIGTTLGMLIADGFGILVGVLLSKRIPDRLIKLVSAGVFAVFGFIGLYETATKDLLLTTGASIAALSFLAVLTAFAAWRILRSGKKASIAPTPESTVQSSKADAP